MKRAFELTQADFESSTGHTPQYMSWHRIFRREFTKFLQSLGCGNVVISRPNHFDMSGFFTSKTGQVFYFSIGDVRWLKDDMLVRTAKDYHDFTGGLNEYATLVDYKQFLREFSRIIA